MTISCPKKIGGTSTPIQRASTPFLHDPKLPPDSPASTKSSPLPTPLRFPNPSPVPLAVALSSDAAAAPRPSPSPRRPPCVLSPEAGACVTLTRAPPDAAAGCSLRLSPMPSGPDADAGNGARLSASSSCSCGGDSGGYSSVGPALLDGSNPGRQALQRQPPAPDQVLAGSLQYWSYMKDLFGDGIFAIDGDKWRHQRKLASHKFSTKVLWEFSSVVFRAHCLVATRQQASERWILTDGNLLIVSERTEAPSQNAMVAWCATVHANCPRCLCSELLVPTEGGCFYTFGSKFRPLRPTSLLTYTLRAQLEI